MNSGWIDGDKSYFDEAAIAYIKLRAAFATCPPPGNPAERVRAMSGEEREAWQYLQARTIAGSVAEGDIACLLAHAGVEYAQNVRRLLSSRALDEEVDRTLPDRGADAGRHISGHVARLYHRWRDPDLLDWLLNTPPHGKAERIARSHALLALWDPHWMQLLRAAAGNPERCRRISDMLHYTLKGSSDALLWQAYLCQLRRGVSSRDLEIRKASLMVLTQLRRRHAPIRASRAAGFRVFVTSPRRVLVRIPS